MNAQPARDFLSPPENLVPVVVGGVVVVGSVGRGHRDGRLEAVGAEQGEPTRPTRSAGTAAPPAARPVTGIADLADQITQACDEFMSDNNDVNTDATIGNIAVGVGVIAAVGTIVYWLVADQGRCAVHRKRSRRS